MKLVGIMPVRNEDWILGLSARVALLWCDEIALYMHACTDRSAEIAHAIKAEHEPGRVQITTDPESTWTEMQHRQQLLIWARNLRKATHIAIIDADEILTANLVNRIRDPIEALPEAGMLVLPFYNLRGSLDRYHSTGVWADRWFAVAFKDTPQASWSGDRYHSRPPGGVRWNCLTCVKHGEGGVLHVWGASERRLVAKQALQKVNERIRWPRRPVHEIDELYNLAIKPQERWDYARVPSEWWAYGNLTYQQPFVHPNSEPWQEAEVRRLVREYGRPMFDGLDLFGVV